MEYLNVPNAKVIRWLRWSTVGLAGVVLPLAVSDPAQAQRLTARDLAQRINELGTGQVLDLSDEDLSELDLSRLDFEKARFRGADLFGVDLSGTSLRKADLREARLDRSTMLGTDFSGADLSDASILRPSTSTTLTITNEARLVFRDARMQRVKMFGRMNYADFSGADLTDAKFQPFGLTGFIEHIWRTEALGANFSRATLRRANFNKSLLRFADMRGADLTGARFVEADLSGADLRGANVTDADFSQADLDRVRLAGVIGLETVKGMASAKNVAKAIR